MKNEDLIDINRTLFFLQMETEHPLYTLYIS